MSGIILSPAGGAKTSNMNLDGMINPLAGDWHDQFAAPSAFKRRPSIFDAIVLAPESE